MNMGTGEIKSKIGKYVMELGVDDVGFANIADYSSPRSPKIDTLFPEAKSIIVLAFKEPANCESASSSLAMNGRLDLMEFSRSCNYKLVRFLEREFKVRAMSVPVSYPLDMSGKSMGLIGEVSLRHAAHAAGLGSFGRHNLIIHPRLGTRVIFTAVMSELNLPSDPMITENLCIDCDICVESCPAGALNEEGKTDNLKCLRVSQPYGIGGSIGFWSKFTKSSPEDQKKMFMGEEFMKLYQAQMIGLQYYCFKCYTSCPIGQV
jgi:epoxyqueuosine reductase QueG